MNVDPDLYLTHGVSTCVGLMDVDSVRQSISEFYFSGIDAARLIGRMANSLLIAGRVDDAMMIAETIPERLAITEPDARYSLWYEISKTAPDRAVPKMYALRGLQPPDHQESNDNGLERQPLGILANLAELGDQRAVVALKDAVLNSSEEQDIKSATRLAVNVFKYDPMASTGLIYWAAERAREYVLQHTPDVEPEDDTADDPVRRMAKSISSALSPSASALESAYAQTDLTLRYFAEDRIRVGDIKSADRLQSLMISPFYSAELSSVRVAEGQDVDGRHAEAVLYYLNAHGSDLNAWDQGIICNLIRGRCQPVIDEVSAVLLDNSFDLDPEEISTDVLVELYNAGYPEAYTRLMQLYPFAGFKQWEYPKALIKMGMHDAAGRLLRSRFSDNSSFRNGLAILRHEFDIGVWLAIQNTIDERTRGNTLHVVEDRVIAIELLAEYIRKMKNHKTSHGIDLP